MVQCLARARVHVYRLGLAGVTAAAVTFGAPAIGQAATIPGLGGLSATGVSGTTTTLENLIAAEGQEMLAIEQAASAAIAAMGDAAKISAQ